MKFDLNIDKVLENWEIHHAVREIIANALDEQTLTETAEIQIFKDEANRWHIRDFGRGLEYRHFTQNENAEKLQHTNLIGKFGVGLKDALATFDRHGIPVEINSRFGHYSTERATKHGFDDLVTLHVSINPPLDPNFTGTDFILTGCDDHDIERAKRLFLRYAKLRRLDSTCYGEIYAPPSHTSEIFVNGIKVAEEENFLFSYNIIAPNATLKKAINRERTNVGRGAYSERVKDILLKATDLEVLRAFLENLNNLSGGEQCDELHWKDVQLHFLKQLSEQDSVIFTTATEVQTMSGRTKEIVDDSHKRLVTVSPSMLETLKSLGQHGNSSINTIDSVIRDYSQGFHYTFIPRNELSQSERAVLQSAPQVIDLIYPEFSLHKVLISETLRPDDELSEETCGVYEPTEDRVIILRRVLEDPSEFLGTLAHELVHAKTGTSDCSRAFETALTHEIGQLLARQIQD